MINLKGGQILTKMDKITKTDTKAKDFDNVLAELIQEQVDEEVVPMSLISDDQVLIRDEAYRLAINYREGFDFKEFQRLYQDYYEKYDYIVGDWAHEKLRLRGFYHLRSRKAPKDRLINFLDDYLKEYCNFGCAYFVLGKAKVIEKFDENLQAYQHQQAQSNDKRGEFGKHEASRDRASRKRRSQKSRKKEDFLIKKTKLVDKSEERSLKAERVQSRTKGSFIIKKQKSSRHG